MLHLKITIAVLVSLYVALLTYGAIRRLLDTVLP